MSDKAYPVLRKGINNKYKIKFRSSNPMATDVYMMIPLHEERLVFTEDVLKNIETEAYIIFVNSSGINCNICNIIRTTVEKWKSHNESKKQEMLLRQSRSKEKKQK